MKRLIRISLDTLLMSTLPIIMWILLGIVVRKEITNVFTLTYPMQFITTLLLAIFGIGANVNATKNNKDYLINSNIILGSLVGLAITILAVLKVNEYIEFMSMNISIYKNFCIYSFILMYLQLVVQLICQKLYYKDETKKSNKLTLAFNITNVALIVVTSMIFRNEMTSILITLIIDAVITLFIFIRNIKDFKLSLELINNFKYVSNDILDRIGMFIIYFIGFRTSLEFGTIYLVAINFETLITDAQWDMSYSIITVATIDASKDKLEYRKSIKNAYKLISILILSSIIMGSVLYFYYRPVLWVLAIMEGVQLIDLLLIPSVWIKQQYCQINYSAKINSFHECVSKGIRILTSFIPTPFCTYIGQLFSMLYQIVIYNFVYRKKYYIENDLLKMK